MKWRRLCCQRRADKRSGDMPLSSAPGTCLCRVSRRLSGVQVTTTYCRAMNDPGAWDICVTADRRAPQPRSSAETEPCSLPPSPRRGLLLFSPKPCEPGRRRREGTGPPSIARAICLVGWWLSHLCRATARRTDGLVRPNQLIGQAADWLAGLRTAPPSPLPRGNAGQ